MKSTILLATALFLISAPAPDSGDIAQITSNFIVPEEISGLLAAEESTQGNRDSVSGWTAELSAGATKQGDSFSTQPNRSEKPELPDNQ